MISSTMFTYVYIEVSHSLTSNVGDYKISQFFHMVTLDRVGPFNYLLSYLAFCVCPSPISTGRERRGS